MFRSVRTTTSAKRGMLFGMWPESREATEYKPCSLEYKVGDFVTKSL